MGGRVPHFVLDDDSIEIHRYSLRQDNISRRAAEVVVNSLCLCIAAARGEIESKGAAPRVFDAITTKATPAIRAMEKLRVIRYMPHLDEMRELAECHSPAYHGMVTFG
jgi:hypothetical protein